MSTDECNRIEEPGNTVISSLQVAPRIDRVVKKAFSTLAFRNQLSWFNCWDVALKLYKTLTRLNLEYCDQFWAPTNRKDVNKIDRVQKKFARMLPETEDLSYRERLNRLILYSLEHRRLRRDLLVYNIIVLLTHVVVREWSKLPPQVMHEGLIQRLREIWICRWKGWVWRAKIDGARQINSSG